MNPANVLQRRWCSTLLERTPFTLRIIRTNVASSRDWLERHPHRVLFRSYHERLVRYERLLDAHGVPMPSPTKTTTKPTQKRQLALSL